jgi:para-nitrobenzyl esterase
MVRDPGRARQIAEHLAGKLGVPATAEAFRGFTTSRLLAAQVEISSPGNLPDLRDEHGVDPLYGLTPFTPVLGDDVLPAEPRESFDAGVDLLAGFNAEEMKLYFVPTGVLGAVTEEQAVATLAASRPDAADVLRGYGLGKEEPAGEVLSKALTDLVFADGVRRLLADHPGHSFGYRFDWRSSAFDGQLGACHGLELPFVFDTLPAATALVGPDAPRELADEMQQTWVRFAGTGDPGWAAGAVRSFG